MAHRDSIEDDLLDAATIDERALRVMLRSYRLEEILGQLNDVEERHAPDRVFTAGRVDLLRRRPRIAIIGTRSPSGDALALAGAIAALVVSKGGIVVSGLARGIDTEAHMQAIASRGSTVAVLGTPLSRAYPPENADLQRQLMEEQLVISQFAPADKTTRASFILRNRTMALVSDGSVIVDAGESSGTEHQGWEALRLGRQLFLPATLVRKPFQWPQKMRAYGASVFEGVEDLGLLFDEFLPVATSMAESSGIPF